MAPWYTTPPTVPCGACKKRQTGYASCRHFDSPVTRLLETRVCRLHGMRSSGSTLPFVLGQISFLARSSALYKWIKSSLSTLLILRS